MMVIRPNIVNTNVFHYFKRKIAVYVINFTKNPSIFKTKQNENILYFNDKWLTTNQIASLQRIIV